MAAIPPKPRQPQKDGRYTQVEKEIIGKYKEEYRLLTTRELQGQLMRERILPVIFNYWNDQGNGPMNEEDWRSRQQALATWIQNNWRPMATTMEQKATVIRVNALDVLWDEHRDLAEKELKGILNMTSVNGEQQRSFEQRTHACKCVLDRMSSQEHVVFDGLMQSQAEKYGNEMVRKWADERWLDMGMITVAFTVHTNTQGRTVVDWLVLDFVKLIKSKDGHSAGGVTTGTQAVGTQAVSTQAVGTQQVGSQPLDILTTTNGFPMVPPDVQGELMKKQWENLLWSYLSAHYYLTSGRLVRQVPFEQVERDTACFVRCPYRPKSLIIKDPRNMHKEDIVQLMQHIYQRQETEGVEQAFRFRLFIGRDKQPFDAVYPDQADESTQRRQVRVNKQSKKGKEIARPTAQDSSTRSGTGTGTFYNHQQMSSPDQVAPADAATRTPDQTRPTPKPADSRQITSDLAAPDLAAPSVIRQNIQKVAAAATAAATASTRQVATRTQHTVAAAAAASNTGVATRTRQMTAAAARGRQTAKKIFAPPVGRGGKVYNGPIQMERLELERHSVIGSESQGVVVVQVIWRNQERVPAAEEWTPSEKQGCEGRTPVPPVMSEALEAEGFTAGGSAGEGTAGVTGAAEGGSAAETKAAVEGAAGTRAASEGAASVGTATEGAATEGAATEEAATEEAASDDLASDEPAELEAAAGTAALVETAVLGVAS
ncbi:hypothetical protein BYT27DRAFT_7209334 [Phlegmacium glaucopus]|nr:hypothetical protein BYT27DRAFT_7209334 [Phlegmacium glaucopus]